MNGGSVYPDTTPHLKVGEALNTEFTEAELRVLREFAPLLEVQNNSSPYRNAQKRQSHKKL